MTRLDAIRARLAANPHASYPELLVEPWPEYVAWLVETVDELVAELRSCRRLLDNRVGTSAILARLEEPE
jgi:hypothetical protein